MKSFKKGTDSVKYAVLLAAGMCANDAMAFGSLGADVDQICATAGNTLLPQFQPAVENNCFACHDDGNGGSGAGRTAYQNGEAAIIDLFCPPAPAPEPPQPTPEPPPAPVCTDADGDGLAAEGGDCGQMDCNDADPAVRPGATEICTDGIDNNCNNLIDATDPNAVGCPVTECTDIDGDDFAIEGGQCGPVDCDDGNAAVNPGEIEICDDGFDNNCDGNADAVDATCQAMNDNEDAELEEEHEKAKHKHRRDDNNDDDDDDKHHDGDDDDDKRDSRHNRRESRDRD